MAPTAGLLFLASVLCAAQKCGDGGCQSNASDDASLLSIQARSRPLSRGSMEPLYKPEALKAHDVMGGRVVPTPESIASAELALYFPHKYGKFEASIQYGGADGVISSFFLWKKGSEKSNVFWNELDFEKLGTKCDGTCIMQLNLIDGMPGPEGHEKEVDLSKLNICSEFHTYGFEWTPTEVRYTVDGVEVHKKTGKDLEEFDKNIGDGMELRFNLWPGDETFGGKFNADSLPVYQFIDWVRYSSYQAPGRFRHRWRENFRRSRTPRHWGRGDWNSPLGYSKHRPGNVLYAGGYAILALTHASHTPSLDSIVLPPRRSNGKPSHPGVSMEPSVQASPSTIASAQLGTWVPQRYGKFEASIRYAPADGVISSFFLWKKGSERGDMFWNELNFEKIGTTCEGSCKMQVNLMDGMPGPESHEQAVDVSHLNICDQFHTYAFEWTPSELRYTVDGVEVRKITGSQLEEFNWNVKDGLEIHFNLWPGDEHFGGEFDANSLPVYQYIDWVRYSSYAGPGHFHWQWQEDFNWGSMPRNWFAGSWQSSKGYSTHRPANVLFSGGYAILALTQTQDTPSTDTIPLP